MNPMLSTDVVIIGAGPVGLFAAFECGMHDLKCHVVDALTQAGGQCAAIYPEKPIFDIPAIPKILGQQLVDALLRQAAPFAPSYHLSQSIDGLVRDGGQWSVYLSGGTEIKCSAVIIAAGAGMLRPTVPDWPGIGQFSTNVHYSVTRLDAFRGRQVVIAGGGDSAMDWAVELVEVAQSVTVIHRRERFRAAPSTIQKVEALSRARRLRVLAPAHVTCLNGEGLCLTELKVQTAEGTLSIPCDDLLLFFGLATDTQAYTRWGVHASGSRIHVDPTTCQTNLRGVFAVGDAVDYPGKLRLILTGFSEAAVAARGAFACCRPGAELPVEYSTARGIPAEHL